MNVINIDKKINESVRNLPDYNHMLGRGLMQPFKPANSGSRALLSSVHVEHFMVLTYGETPLVQTGYETEFGTHSTSYIVADHPYKIVAKFNKFSFSGNHYYLILQNLDTGEFDYVERVGYRYNTESYGYLWDNHRIDNFKVGDVIESGEIVKTSIGFDEYGNKKNGVNLVTMYLSCAQNMEDSVIISESAASKLETTLIKNTSIMINDNDILLNLYGTDGNYKTFPDIGEYVRNGMFCAIRRVENKDILFSLSATRQKDIMLSDRPILLDGMVCDIDVYSNSPDTLNNSVYNSQLYKYYLEKMNLCRQINEYVGEIAMNNKLSYELEKFYARCRDTVLGKEYYKEKQFNNVILEVTIAQALPMDCGDKLSDRYGGKGVVSRVLPDKLMPLLDNGQRVEIIKNQSTCINRENIGQLHEQSLTFIGMRILDKIKDGVENGTMYYSEAFKLWYDFVSMVDPEQADYALMYVDPENENTCKLFMDSVLEDEGIILSSQPFTTNINIDTIREIYDKFPWIKPYEVMVPVEDSNGNIRHIHSRRNLVVGKIYNYRLKQYAEEKFSVTSLSATNLKNLNTRSRANKIYEVKYTKTPIMFGFMESCDLCHIGMQYVVMNLMLYSNSPQARRLFEELLIGNPYDIDIRLDGDSKNRNAEIINALFKTMGVRLEFSKTLKKKKYLCNNILYKTIPNSEWKPKTNILDIIGYDDIIDLRYATAKQHKTKTIKIANDLLYRRLDENGHEIFRTNINEILGEYEKSLSQGDQQLRISDDGE